MKIFLLTVTIYALTIFFAFLIAAIVHGLGVLVKKIHLEPEENPPDMSMPNSDALKEEESVAVAIALAAAARSGRAPRKPATQSS